MPYQAHITQIERTCGQARALTFQSEVRLVLGSITLALRKAAAESMT